MTNAATTDIIKRYMTVMQTAEYLGLSRHTIYRMIDDNVIPCTSFGKNGRTKRFDRVRIDEWVKARSTEGKT